MQHQFKRGEVLVGVLLLCGAVGVLLPRAQASREDAARQKCQDNLRAIGQGFHEFEKTQGGFPARRIGYNDGNPHRGWGAEILPHIGETELAKKYDYKLDSFDPGNKAVVETPVKVFRCPATPINESVLIRSQASSKSTNPDKDTVFAVNGGANDYIASNAVLFPRGGYGLNYREADQMGGNQRQATTDNVNLPLSKITDGLSCTLLLIEQAGRPGTWRNGKRQKGDGQFGNSANERGMWAGWGSIGFGPAGADGVSPAKGDSTDCSVNCNNWFGIYGFHPAGANVLMSDGSVRFIGKSLDPLTYAYLTIRDDGHLISPSDY